MPLGTFLSLLAACAGTLSAIFFAVGTLSLKGENIRDIATTYLGTNQHLAAALSNQRAEYAVGAFVLIITFVLQVAANVVAPTTQPELLKSPTTAIGIASASLGVVAIVALLGCRWLSSRMNARVIALLKDRNSEMERKK